MKVTFLVLVGLVLVCLPRNHEGKNYHDITEMMLKTALTPQKTYKQTIQLKPDFNIASSYIDIMTCR